MLNFNPLSSFAVVSHLQFLIAFYYLSRIVLQNQTVVAVLQFRSLYNSSLTQWQWNYISVCRTVRYLFQELAEFEGKASQRTHNVQGLLHRAVKLLHGLLTHLCKLFTVIGVALHSLKTKSHQNLKEPLPRRINNVQESSFIFLFLTYKSMQQNID